MKIHKCVVARCIRSFGGEQPDGWCRFHVSPDVAERLDWDDTSMFDSSGTCFFCPKHAPAFQEELEVMLEDAAWQPVRRLQ